MEQSQDGKFVVLRNGQRVSQEAHGTQQLAEGELSQYKQRLMESKTPFTEAEFTIKQLLMD